jgi:cytochrome b6-f complex iron-sulfur subunit
MSSSERSKEIEREVFLKKAVLFLSCFLGLIFFLPSLLIIYPKEFRKKRLRYFLALPEEEAPNRGVKPINFSYQKKGRQISITVFLVRETNTLKALSPYCSHLGCRVIYRRGEKVFVCPCHGGRYDMQGKNISGPPPKPLSHLPVKIKGGKIFMGIKV